MTPTGSQGSKSASGGETSAPDDPVAGFRTGNDPTDGSIWIRRTLHLEGTPNETAVADALDGLLDLPGIARARPSGHRAVTVDMRPDVLSDQELQDAFGRGALDVETWDDESLPLEISGNEDVDVRRSR